MIFEYKYPDLLSGDMPVYNEQADVFPCSYLAALCAAADPERVCPDIKRRFSDGR
jgi:hypothetical protein